MVVVIWSVSLTPKLPFTDANADVKPWYGLFSTSVQKPLLV